MKKLSYSLLREQGYSGYLLRQAPERVIQFGEGNFMRAFVDYFIDILNEKTGFDSKVVLVQPIPKSDGFDPGTALNEQEGLYTLYLRGGQTGQKREERRIISCVSRCLNIYADYSAVLACAENPELRYIACNTTEAGIVYDPACRLEDTPPQNYPAKLTQFLYRRFKTFGAAGKGFIILACELIDDNGRLLRQYVLDYARQWNLETEFIDWLKKENIFCSTLVDRIVTGYPAAESAALETANGYIDQVLDTGELFGLWVIEGPDWLKKELPFAEADLPVLITADHKPYKERKVRILNGAHTAVALGAYLAGQDFVGGCLQDETIFRFIRQLIYQEIIPTLSLPPADCTAFADAVLERFQNPFIQHSLLAISLNSTAKWKARLLPSLKAAWQMKQQLPPCLTAAFAFYLAFYHGREMTAEGLRHQRPANAYLIKDDPAVLQFFADQKDTAPLDYVTAVCRRVDFWGEDLSLLPGFAAAVSEYLNMIQTQGVLAVMNSCFAPAATGISNGHLNS